MIRLKSQSAKSKLDSLATIRIGKILQIMNSFLFVTFCISGEDIAKTFIASNWREFYHNNIFMYKLHVCFIMMKVAFMTWSNHKNMTWDNVVSRTIWFIKGYIMRVIVISQQIWNKRFWKSLEECILTCKDGINRKLLQSFLLGEPNIGDQLNPW